MPTEKTPYTKFNMAGYAWYNEPRQSSDPNENGILEEITYLMVEKLRLPLKIIVL